MKSRERRLANKIAAHWYNELHGKYSPIFQKQMLSNYVEEQLKNLGMHSVMPRFVGVVCPTKHLYKQWVKDIGSQTYGADANFRHIRAIDDIIGVEFHTVEKGYQYWRVDSDIYDAAALRVW